MTMTDQEIFNKVVEHSRTLPGPAVGNTGTCMYKSPSGLKCFIGCLIPDDLYEKDFEKITLRGFWTNEPNVLEKFLAATNVKESQFQFLAGLQRIHDTYVMTCWEDELKQFAKNHNLTFPERN